VQAGSEPARPEELQERCLLCGNEEIADLQASTLESGRMICRDLDACYLRLIKERWARLTDQPRKP
jgi:hypothetical protein